MLARIRKAIAAGILAGGSTYAGVLDGGITTGEWELIVGSVIVTAVVTWLVPNRADPKPPAGVTGQYVGK